MKRTTGADVWSALLDMITFHFQITALWFLGVLAVVAVAEFLELLRAIYTVHPGPSLPPEFRQRVVDTAVIGWVITTLCGYVGGFVMGRLYKPTE